MQDESDARLAGIVEEYTVKVRGPTDADRQLKLELTDAKARIAQLIAALQTEIDNHGVTSRTQQAESIMRHTAEQQVVGLKERLAETEAHRLSLEDKHSHARQALEHYRQAAKEQRDQEVRRHEHQVQQLQAELRQSQLAAAVKQEKVTRLNQDGAKLVADLSHFKQSLHEQLTSRHNLEQKIEHLQVSQQHAAHIERRLTSKIAKVEQLSEQLSLANAQLGSALARAQDLNSRSHNRMQRSKPRHRLGNNLKHISTRMQAALVSNQDRKPRTLKR